MANSNNSFKVIIKNSGELFLITRYKSAVIQNKFVYYRIKMYILVEN